VSLPAVIGSRYRANRGRSAHVVFELVASAPEAEAGCYRHTMRYVAHEGLLPEQRPEIGSTFTVEDAWFRERSDIKTVAP
jgi:hypothetical protein